MLTESQVAEIKKRAERGDAVEKRASIAADRDALLADRDELVRRLAKVRERAIWRLAYAHADEYACRLCRTAWIMGREPETHAADCPAAPVAAA